MPADIAVIGGEAAMAYLGESPWHRLGVPLTSVERYPGETVVAHAMRAARLDWTVRLRDLWFRPLNADGTTGEPKSCGRFAVVRDTDQQMLGHVGGDYVPLQNSEAFGVLNAACEQHGVVIETAGALGKGERVWMLARLPESVEPVAGDRVDGYMLLLTGHDGWQTYQGLPTAVRVVCANTLAMALAAGQAPIKLFHRKKELEQMEMVAVTITKAVAALRKTGETFAKLAEKRMTLEQMDAYFSAVLGVEDNASTQMVNRKLRLLELAQTGRGVELAPGTAWVAFNAVTEFVDHGRPAGAKAKTLRSADMSALFGPMAKLKVRALDLALAA